MKKLTVFTVVLIAMVTFFAWAWAKKDAVPEFQLAVLGDNAELIRASNHKKLTLDTDGKYIMGYLDVFKLEDSVVRVSGWAADKENRIPAQRVLLFVGERLVRQIKPTVDRPDVALAKGESYLRSGWEADLPKDLFGKDKGRLRVIALTKADRARELQGASDPFLKTEK